VALRQFDFKYASELVDGATFAGSYSISEPVCAFDHPNSNTLDAAAIFAVAKGMQVRLDAVFCHLKDSPKARGSA
jgi:hypothetical protein